MAGSRLEKIGTIFSRTSGLLRSAAMKPEDKPIWYDVYAAFPPLLEPRYDRPAPNVPVRQIFYEEDIVRAKYHRTIRQTGSINLSDNKYQTQTQQFLSTYAHIKAQGAISEEAIFDAAVEVVNDKLSKEYDDNLERGSPGLLDSFSEAKASTKKTVPQGSATGTGANTSSKGNINISSLFND